MPLSDAALEYYSVIYYRDLIDEETSYNVAQDIRSMAKELQKRRQKDTK